MVLPVTCQWLSFVEEFYCWRTISMILRRAVHSPEELPTANVILLGLWTYETKLCQVVIFDKTVTQHSDRNKGPNGPWIPLNWLIYQETNNEDYATPLFFFRLKSHRFSWILSFTSFGDAARNVLRPFSPHCILHWSARSRTESGEGDLEDVPKIPKPAQAILEMENDNFLQPKNGSHVLEAVENGYFYWKRSILD